MWITLGLGLLLLVSGAQALCLNEVLADPAGSEYEDEFIELLQNDSLGLDVAGLRISDGSATDELIAWNGGPTWVEPGGLVLILDPGHQGAYLQGLPAGCVLLTVPDGALGSGGLSNSTAEELSLLDAAGTTLDRIRTRPGLGSGHSLERREAGADCDSCWRESRELGGTPGRPNSVRLRAQELTVLGWNAQGLTLQATGQAGFAGQLALWAGLPPCLDSLFLSVALEAGTVGVYSWPAWPLPGGNPLRARAYPSSGEEQALLDSVGWRDPQPGELFIEALQPEGHDWLQLRGGDCPVLLDGWRLSGRSFSLSLAGQLWSQERLLLGDVSPACPGGPQDSRSLGLSLAGGVDLKGPDGQLVDSAVWPEPDGQGRAWRRLDSARSGGDPGNWLADGELAPGCVPLALPAPTDPPASWWLSGRWIQPGGEESALLVVEAAQPSGSPWQFEVWTLEGRLRARLVVRAPRLVWDGRDENGRRLDDGLYVLRLSGAGREELHPLGLMQP